MDGFAELEGMLATGEVARELRVSQATVCNWVREGRLRCTKTSLGRLFEPMEVERLARERELARGREE